MAHPRSAAELREHRQVYAVRFDASEIEALIMMIRRYTGYCLPENRRA
jgi:hypothetical protein